MAVFQIGEPIRCEIDADFTKDLWAYYSPKRTGVTNDIFKKNVDLSITIRHASREAL